MSSSVTLIEPGERHIEELPEEEDGREEAGDSSGGKDC